MSNQIQKLDKLNHRVDFNEITKESQNNLKALEGKIRTKNLQSTYQMTSFKQDEVNQDIVLIYRDIIDSLKDVNRSISRKNVAIGRQEKKIKKTGKKNKHDYDAEAVLEMLVKERMTFEQIKEKIMKNYTTMLTHLGYKESISLPMVKEEEESSASKMLEAMINRATKQDITVNNNISNGSREPPSSTSETIEVKVNKPTNPLDDFITAISN